MIMGFGRDHYKKIGKTKVGWKAVLLISLCLCPVDCVPLLPHFEALQPAWEIKNKINTYEIRSFKENL
jgi:hypothetical protein